MQKNSTNILPPHVPSLHFGGTGKFLHFAHANAYPPGCYGQFIQPFLGHFEVEAMLQRPLWLGHSPHQFSHWNTLANDLIQYLDYRKVKKIVGMGHSMGGVATLLAAIQRPDLFSKLVLIDPVIFSSPMQQIMQFLPFSWRKKMIPVAKIASKRRNEWESQEAVYQSFRTKKVFKRFSDSVLRDFVNASTYPAENGQKVRLTYAKEWETQIYITAPAALKKIRQLTVPTIVIKGEFSNVITEEVWSKWKAMQPNHVFLEYPDSGHLLPMEYPQEVAAWLLQQLS